MNLTAARIHHLPCAPLGLPLCGAGPMGVEALCKGLKAAGSSGLKELDLSHTAADDKAAAVLAGLLSSSRMLERLVLTHTSISDAGVQLLCNALQVSPVRAAASYQRHQAPCVGCLTSVCAVCCLPLVAQDNTTLQSINVSNNDNMDKSWQKLLNHLVKGKAKN